MYNLCRIPITNIYFTVCVWLYFLLIITGELSWVKEIPQESIWSKYFSSLKNDRKVRNVEFYCILSIAAAITSDTATIINRVYYYTENKTTAEILLFWFYRKPLTLVYYHDYWYRCYCE